RAAVILIAPEVLRIPDVGIVIEPLPVGATILPAPDAAKRPILSFSRRSQACQQHTSYRREQHPPNHGWVPRAVSCPHIRNSREQTCSWRPRGARTPKQTGTRFGPGC